MYNNKLIKHLKRLERKEFTRFKQYINSPYHNKHKDVIRLVDYLDKIYPNFNKKNCDRSELIKRVFSASITNNKLAVVFTYTYNLLHKYYRQEAFSLNKEEQDLILLDKLKNLNEKDLFYEVLGKRLNNTLGSYNNYRIEQIKESFENRLGNITTQEQFIQKQTYLDHFYLLEKIHQICEGITLSRITKETYPLDHYESILNIIKLEAQKSKDLFIFYITYKTISGKIEFDEGLNIIKETEKELSIVKPKEIYNLLQNFCIFKINQGDRNFLINCFNIYNIQLSRDFLVVEGILPESHYKNITTIGLRIEKFEWTFDFIHNYKSKLPADISENAYGFNLANYYFSIGDLDKALDLLRNIDIKDLRYALATRALQIRIFYEQDEFDALFSMAATFKTFLKRNKKLNDSRVKAFSNLLNLTISCSKYKSRKDYQSKSKSKLELERIKTKLNNSDQIINRSWIESKIQSLTEQS